jgi:hypothetical protein
MPTLITYRKPEEASRAMAFLQNQGIDALVQQDPAFGGPILGGMETVYHLEVAEDQTVEARGLLLGTPSQHKEAGGLLPINERRLGILFRCLLVFDVVFMLFWSLFAHRWAPTPPQEVSDYLATLVHSPLIWQHVYDTLWPALFAAALADILCFFYLPFGRVLLALSLLWTAFRHLGPPTEPAAPWESACAFLQTLSQGMTLGLMWWSPIRQRFAGNSSLVEAARIENVPTTSDIILTVVEE